MLNINKLIIELDLKRWMKKSFLNYFFMKYLNKLEWVIEKVNDLRKIKNVKDISLAWLWEIMKEMKNDSVIIVDWSLFLE